MCATGVTARCTFHHRLDDSSWRALDDSSSSYDLSGSSSLFALSHAVTIRLGSGAEFMEEHSVVDGAAG